MTAGQPQPPISSAVLDKVRERLNDMEGHEILALAGELGMSRQGLYTLRAGKTIPNVVRFGKIAAALGYELRLVEAEP